MLIWNRSTSDADDLKWVVECDFDANGYRLPTEAEWEYACKMGEPSYFREIDIKNYVDMLTYDYSRREWRNQIAWYGDNSDGKYRPVGIRDPNRLGIYDMNGNVKEWCWDWYWFDGDYYLNKTLLNPHGPEQGSYRVVRGGDYSSEWWQMRGSSYGFQDGRTEYNGFRLSRSYIETNE